MLGAQSRKRWNDLTEKDAIEMTSRDEQGRDIKGWVDVICRRSLMSQAGKCLAEGCFGRKSAPVRL